MTEHVHGCLNCRPDMVPEFRRDDPRYHDYDACGTTLCATVDGVVPGYHKGVFEGEEGWVLLACPGFDADGVHLCPTCTTYRRHEPTGCPIIEHCFTCLEPRFGHVEVEHDCPKRLVARAERLMEALQPLVDETTYLRALYGADDDGS